MEAALSSKAKVIDINHAGTAMRFLTAYFSQVDGRSFANRFQKNAGKTNQNTC